MASPSHHYLKLTSFSEGLYAARVSPHRRDVDGSLALGRQAASLQVLQSGALQVIEEVVQAAILRSPHDISGRGVG